MCVAEARARARRAPRIPRPAFLTPFAPSPVPPLPPPADVIQNLPEFDGKRLQSITKEGLQLPDDSGKGKRIDAAYKEEFKPLTVALKKVLGDKVEKVTVSNRLDKTPAVLVTSQFGYSSNMERIMKSQAFANQERGAVMAAKKTLEINPRHPIIAALKSKFDAETNEASSDVEDMARLLYDAALLNSGFSLEDTPAFSSRVYGLVSKGLDLESLDLLPEIEVPEEEPSPSATPAPEAAVEDDEAEL